MSQRFSLGAGRAARDDDALSARPFYLVLYLVMIAGYVTALLSVESLREPMRLVPFTAMLLLHGGLYWLSQRWTAFGQWWWAYFVVQAALAFGIGLLARGHWLPAALYLPLAGQMAGTFWPRLRAVALAAVLCFALLAVNLTMSWGPQAFVQFWPIGVLTFAFVLIYVVLFVRQEQAREHSQALLQELEVAHRQLQEYAAQVEELSVGRERERMARELHDTLAQGLAGLILQLEAADGHLEGGNPIRAQEVVQQAMQRARTTLQEARRAIQSLRPAALEQGNLMDAIRREIQQFAADTGVRTTLAVGADAPDVSPAMAQDILRIVQESLSNVARHAQASHVRVRLAENRHGLVVVVQDDGVGFDPAEGLERPGCYGVAGMRERARRLGGALRVESAPGEGTSVILSVQEADRGEGREG
jgi:NarL family two-component system sensor histidine kinase YdfH